MNKRVERVLNGFIKQYKHETNLLVECGGRIEILGNHTDHNHGKCLVAGCDLTILSAISVREDEEIRVLSLGLPPIKLSANDLENRKSDIATSTGLIRGVAKYFKDHDLKVGGFEAYMESNIFQGAGVSSSAAFESLIGEIFNVLYNDGQVSKLTIAKAGQFAENNYFGKKSGLLDQIGTAFGGISYLDFSDPLNPIITPLKGNYSHLHFVLVNTGGSHALLSDLYSSIPNDMYYAAKKLGVNYLEESSLDELVKIKDQLNESQYLRSKHFFLENERVEIAKDAINYNDWTTFYKMVRLSQESSKNYLKNTMVDNIYENSPQEAIDYSSKFLKVGAARINGGGFAGTIIAFVPDEEYDAFIINMTLRYGKKNVREVKINHEGAHSFKI